MDQDVYPAERTCGFLDEAAAFIRLGNISRRAIKPASQRYYLLLQLFCFTAAARSQHRDISAALGKRQRRCGADSTCTACYQAHSIQQIHSTTLH
jgi:hypothetical protein